MSIVLPIVDLTTATVGGTGTIDWSRSQPTVPPGLPANDPDNAARLRLFNESGCGLSVQFPDSGRSDFIPAGGWITYPLAANETQLRYTVQYILPGAPVASLIAIYYRPHESPTGAPVLGNSPIGVGGTVTTSVGNSLKNDGSGPATSLIEATPSDQTSSSWSLDNDASGFLQVLSAGVLRKILDITRGNSGTGKASIVIGDAGDSTITLLYGVLAKISSDAGAISSDGSGALTCQLLFVNGNSILIFGTRTDPASDTSSGLKLSSTASTLDIVGGTSGLRIVENSGSSYTPLVTVDNGGNVAMLSGQLAVTRAAGAGSIFAMTATGAVPAGGQTLFNGKFSGDTTARTALQVDGSDGYGKFSAGVGGAAFTAVLKAIATGWHMLQSLLIDGTLSVVGASSLDNGALTTDGSGNLSGVAGSALPTTRNGVATSVPHYTGTSTPSSPPTGSVWVKA